MIEIKKVKPKIYLKKKGVKEQSEVFHKEKISKRGLFFFAVMEDESQSLIINESISDVYAKKVLPDEKKTTVFENIVGILCLLSTIGGLCYYFTCVGLEFDIIGADWFGKEFHSEKNLP